MAHTIKNEQKEKIVRFLIIGDLHGNKPVLYRRKFDAIIAPGDFCSDKLRKYIFQALRLNMQLNKVGINVEWCDLIGKKRALQMVKKSVADGRKILEFLNRCDVPVFVLPGNWDWTSGEYSDWKALNKGYWGKLKKGLKNIHDIHLASRKFRHVTLIGHGITSGPEKPSKRLLNKATNAERRAVLKYYTAATERIAHLFRKRKNSPVIFLTHNVPYNTPIDLVTDHSSPAFGEHKGSVIARETVKKYRPLICIGGHMHEHFTSCRLGKTICVNAGFGSYVNVYLEIFGSKIKKLVFIKSGKRQNL